MITILGRHFYWPGERKMIARMWEERENKHLANAQALMFQDQRDYAETEVVRLTDLLLKAQGIYAGPMAGYMPATGDGFQIDDDLVLEADIIRHQGRFRRLELEASVKLRGPGRDLREATCVEWEGIKWKCAEVHLVDGEQAICAVARLVAYIEPARHGMVGEPK